MKDPHFCVCFQKPRRISESTKDLSLGSTTKSAVMYFTVFLGCFFFYLKVWNMLFPVFLGRFDACNQVNCY